MSYPLLILCFFLILAVIFWPLLEKRNTYFPDYPARQITATPADLGLPYQDIYLTAADGVKINGWFVPVDRSATFVRPTVLIFHGNAGNIGDRLPLIKIFHDLGLNVCLIDYRGFGKSQGSPSEKGLYLDSQAAYLYLLSRPEVATKKIVLYGESLGAAVAFDLAGRQPAAAIITEGAFTSLPDLAADIYRLPPLRILVFSKYNSLKKIKDIFCPILIIHGQSDQVVPLAHGRKLFTAAPGPKELLPLSGRHCEVIYLDPPRAQKAIGSFLKKFRIN